MVGAIERYLLDKIKADGSIHMTLIDPENVTPGEAAQVAETSRKCGTAAIMVGGSTVSSQSQLDEVVKAIKAAVDVPTILFPGNVNGISRYADAIWFMSMINSQDRFFLVGAQVLGAPYVKRFNIEPIPMGYVIVGDGGTVGKVGKANSIPYSNPQLAADHALAAQYFGMRFVYLEAGSGAAQPVPTELIRQVKSTIDAVLIVGGGIRSKEQALAAVEAGADIIVTGNLTESSECSERILQIIQAIKH